MVKRYLSFEMASSSSIPEFILNPTIVENIKHPRLRFKIIPEIAKQDDFVVVFSKTPKGVAFAEDPRIYIHCNIEDLGTEDLKKIFNEVITDENSVIKTEHKIVEDLGFVEILNIPEFPKEV